MARHRTRKQKQSVSLRLKKETNQFDLVIKQTTALKKKKNKTTVFSQSQVKLLYKDLLKTALVTLIVFAVLLSIFVYMR